MTTIDRFSAYDIETGVDENGLGRWSWIHVGSNEKRTRIAVAYQPHTPARTSKGGAVFEQHQCFFKQRGDFQSPRTIFYKHLVSLIIIWRGRSKEIVLCGDFNEHVYTGRLAHCLAQSDILMSEQCLQTNKKRLPPTFVTGLQPINAVLATEDVDTINASILKKLAE